MGMDILLAAIGAVLVALLFVLPKFVRRRHKRMQCRRHEVIRFAPDHPDSAD